MNSNIKPIKASLLSLINSRRFSEIIDSDYEELKSLSTNINTNYLNFNILDIEDTVNHYDRLTKCIIFDFKKDKLNKKGSYSTFYHELGHHIDWELSLPSSSERFRKNLMREGINFLNTINIKSLESFILKEAKASGLSDILSGITLNKYRFKYKHSNKYWLSSSTKVSFEAFAHFYEAYIRNDEFRINLYKSVFPLTFNMFTNVIDSKKSAKANIA